MPDSGLDPNSALCPGSSWERAGELTESCVMAVYWSSGQDSDLTAKGAGSIPGRGTKILQVVWQGKKKKNQVSWHQEPMRAHLGVSHLTHTGRVCVCVCVCRVDVRMASWRGQSFRSWPGRGRRKNISSEGDHLCKGQEQKPRGMRNRKHKPQRLMVCLFSGL